MEESVGEKRQRFGFGFGSGNVETGRPSSFRDKDDVVLLVNELGVRVN